MASSLARTLPLLLVATVTLDCSDDAMIVTTTSDTATHSTSNSSSATTGTTSATDPSTTTTASTGSTSSSSAETGTTTSGPETGTGTTDTTSTDTTSTSTTAGTTGTTSDTGVMEDAEYAARYLAGGLDRIFIRKAEKVSGLCTHIGLVLPDLEDEYEITTPKGWSVELVAIAEELDGCLDFEGLAPVPVEAVAAAGSVAWIDDGFCPATLDIDVTAEFLAGDLPWVPMKDQLFAEALAVEGCP